MDLLSIPGGESHVGTGAATILVRNNRVDLSDIESLVNMCRAPPGKHNVAVLKNLKSFEGVTLRDFLIALFNLSNQAHRDLADRLFSQAGCRSFSCFDASSSRSADPSELFAPPQASVLEI